MIPAGEGGGEADPDLRAHVERALHELPTLQRAVVILRHLNGLSTREVGNILHCSEGTVKTHLFRGLEKMRQRLQFLQEDVA
jgi:RNA polymerase sigma factor (sigma-70 family)